MDALTRFTIPPRCEPGRMFFWVNLTLPTGDEVAFLRVYLNQDGARHVDPLLCAWAHKILSDFCVPAAQIKAYVQDPWDKELKRLKGE